MVSVRFEGRLGNNLIQYLVAKLFAKKNNLFLKSEPHIENLSCIKKIDNTGNNFENSQVVQINDYNFLDFFNEKKIGNFHYRFDGFFQKKEFFYKYGDEIKKLIDYKIEPKDETDFFIHYRIGDNDGSNRMLPLEYYIECIEKFGVGKGFISTDSIGHPNCNYLIEKYNLTPINLSDIDTILHGKNFNNLILSEGTFSWWIGFLSDAKNIFCNKREFKWHGDIFFEDWDYTSWEYDGEKNKWIKL